MPDGANVAPTSTALVTLPNIISLARLCAVPLAVWLILQHREASAFVLFLGAGLSDAVDGWLARRGRRTVLGAVLDPLADKALLVSMFVVLAASEALPDWLAILVVFRDILIVGGVGVLAFMGQRVTIRPIFVSKVNTALQILLVALALLLTGYRLQAPVAMEVLIWLVAASTLASGVAYLRQTVRGG
jgi:cardiolipin synthase (CMP-forming)